MESFGKRVREIRIAKKITLREISQYLGKSIGYLSDVEHDRKGPPDLETVGKLEEFLGINDGTLIHLASRLRRKVPKDVTLRIKMRPQLSELLLRADDLTDQEITDLIESLDDKKRGEG